MHDHGREPASLEPARCAIEELLVQDRAGLDRVAVADLPAEVLAGAVVVDIRPVDQRDRDGVMPGALVIDRNVLEWRLDPTSPDRLPVATSSDVRYVLVCDGGYSSSLAAATLRRLGLARATDLIGGFQAWSALLRTDDTGSASLAPLHER